MEGLFNGAFVGDVEVGFTDGLSDDGDSDGLSEGD